MFFQKPTYQDAKDGTWNKKFGTNQLSNMGTPIMPVLHNYSK